MFLMPSNLYSYITQNENMKTLNKLKIKYQDAKEIIIGFIKHDQSNLSVLSEFLEKNATLYQFLYGNLFPKCFCRIDDYGIRAKTLFSTYYHNLNIHKNVINWQNNNLEIKEEPEEYDNASPINMTQLNDDTGNDEDNIEKIKIEKQNNKEKKKKTKRKINNTEAKEKKTELKKQGLLEQLNENTEKLKNLKKKIN